MQNGMKKLAVTTRYTMKRLPGRLPATPLAIQAILVTAIAGLMMVLIFSYWKERTSSPENAKKLGLLEQMEKTGIPEITKTTVDGGQVSTAAFRGKVVFINFWASWCEPCVAEVPSLIALMETFPEQAELIAISEDNSAEDIQAFIKAFPKIKAANIHIIWDEDRQLMKTYHSERLPESFVVGKDGHLVKKVVGSINWHTADSEEFVKSLLQ